MEKIIDYSTTQLRQLQLNELEMLVEVDRICRKHGIKYSLDGGTLLGAIRHQGFIPWDDDVDVIFTREEYNKFFEACKKDLKKDLFFLQDYRTDPYYRWGFAKLRHLNTEFVRQGQEHMKYKTGVNIDIFVLDNVPDNSVLKNICYGINFAIRKTMYSEIGMKNEESALMRCWYSVLHIIPKKLAFGIRDLIAKNCNKKKTKLVSHLLYPYPKRCKYGISAEYFTEYVDVEFEGMKFLGIKEYDPYLSILYGDYMTLPPEEQRHSAFNHSAVNIKLANVALEEIQSRYKAENK